MTRAALMIQAARRLQLARPHQIDPNLWVASSWQWLSKPYWDPILVGEFTTHFRTYFSGDWDATWVMSTFNALHSQGP